MSRKIISLFTLLAFIIFSLSCYTWKTEKVQTVADRKGKKVEILSVVKTSGEHIEFSKYRPGRIYEDTIVGTVRIATKEVEIDRANIKSIKKDQKGNISEIISKDEKIYNVVTGTVRARKDKIIFFATYESPKSVSIPLSEVKLIQVKRLDPFKTFLLSFSIAGVIVGAAILYVLISMKDFHY